MKLLSFCLRSLPVVILIMFSGCSQFEFSEIEFPEDNSIVFEEKVFLTEIGQKEFNLDKESGFWHYSMGIDKVGDKEYLTYVNEINNSIYVYDYQNKKLLSKIPLEREGPNGVGNLSLSSHVMLGVDSFMVYNVFNGGLYFVNSLGTVEKKVQIRDYSQESDQPNPEPSLTAPIQIIGTEVYFACSLDRYMTDYGDSYTVMAYDLETGNRRFLFPHSDVYSSGYWGAVFKYIPSFDYDVNRDRVILSFPIDPNLYVMSLGGQMMTSHFESSQYIREMPPMRENIQYGIKKDHSVPDLEQKEYSLATSDFIKIIYDHYRDVYYRVAYLRPSKEQLRSGRRLPDIAISILDSDFNKIGEEKFDGMVYRPSMIFLSSEGLNLGRTDMYNRNENLMTFSLFQLTSNQLAE